jgi:hypothetical protein
VTTVEGVRKFGIAKRKKMVYTISEPIGQAVLKFEADDESIRERSDNPWDAKWQKAKN